MLKWSAVAAIALYGWVNGTLASGVAQLDDRLGLGATLVGAHLASFAVGLLVTGALTNSQRLAPFAPAAFATTIVLFLAAPHPAVSLTACLVLGASGSLTLARAQAVLADPLVTADPPRTLMIANVMAAGTAATAAAAVGVVDPDQAVLTTAPALVLALVARRSRAVKSAAPIVDLDVPELRERRRPGRSATERASLILIAVFVAIELAVANQLTGHLVGVDAAEIVSDTAVGVLFVGLTLGRALFAVIGASRTPGVMTAAATTTMIALLVITIAPNDPVIVVAVLALGFSLGPLFPLLIAHVLAASDEPARTSALTTTAIGTAVLLSPPTVGATRELVGDRAGLSLLTALAAVAVVLTLVHRGRASDRTRSEEPRTTRPASGNSGGIPSSSASTAAKPFPR